MLTKEERLTCTKVWKTAAVDGGLQKHILQRMTILLQQILLYYVMDHYVILFAEQSA